MREKKKSNETEVEQNAAIQSPKTPEPEMEEGRKKPFFSRLIGKFKKKHQQKLEEIENKKLSAEETKLVEEKVEEAGKEVSKSNSKKTKIKNIVFFFFSYYIIINIF